MDLKLNNNQHLTVSTFPDSIKAKITTVYIKDCREITENAFSFLNSIMSLLESITPKLSRIRVDIGACSGSYSDLMKFSNLYGFDDDYNYQEKPRFVGSYYINTWHTIEQLNNARSIFESADFTISNDSTKIINFNDVAVQTLDSTKPNYNPAVAIVLQAHGLGITMSEYPFGCGKWFLLKTEAATITSINNWFYAKTTLTDVNGVVSDDTAKTYDFDEFDEFEFFTGIGTVGGNNAGFMNCTKLRSLKFPPNNIIIGRNAGCSALTSVIFTGSFRFGNPTGSPYTMCFNGAAVESIDLTNLTTTQIPYGCFGGCRKLKQIILPNTITYLGDSCFNNAGNSATFAPGDTLDINLPNLTFLGTAAFSACKAVTSISNLGTITSINQDALRSLSRATFIELPETVTYIGTYAIAFSASNTIIRCLAATPPTAADGFLANNSKVYVGEGESAADDNAILANYVAATGWSAHASQIDTWYNYLHPQS